MKLLITIISLAVVAILLVAFNLIAVKLAPKYKWPGWTLSAVIIPCTIGIPTFIAVMLGYEDGLGQLGFAINMFVVIFEFALYFQVKQPYIRERARKIDEYHAKSEIGRQQFTKKNAEKRAAKAEAKARGKASGKRK